MAVREILEYPDPELQRVSEPVTEFDDSVSNLVDDLLDTLYATSGIGLCAPQLGERRRVLVMDLSDEHSAPEVYVNPEILKSALPGFVEERCLSVPGFKANVIRATRVLVRAHDRDGQVVERDLEGMHAVCLQHEMDHFEGKLLIDRLAFLRRLRAQSVLKKRHKERAGGRDAA